MKFELSKKEQERARRLYKKWKKRLKGQNVNLYYSFYPTGIGNGVKVGCKALGVEEDITDMDSW